ncbi:MAG TPA: hypothetical protein VEA81_09755 [Burkholderiaceae bacterium]|nr:hypothetical protein [Burkholderiaceae bacterium]
MQRSTASAFVAGLLDAAIVILCAAVLLALFAAGGCAHAPRTAPPGAPADGAVERYRAGVARLVAGHLDDGQVVSRNADGAAAHRGEALIWTWTLIGTLGCEDGAPLLARALERLRSNSGALYRYEPLPDEYVGGNEVSLDGEIGYWYGVARRLARCPADRELLAEAWQLRQAAVDGAGGRLHPNVAQSAYAELSAVRDQVAYALGLRGEPAADRLEVLGGQLAAWAGAVAAAKAPCYRWNLAWLLVRTLEAAGRSLPGGGRNAFCAVTAGGDVPTVDHWCGRPGLAEFLAGYVANSWEYRFQRCGAWEAPDGAGLATPGLDELVALRELYVLD